MGVQKDRFLHLVRPFLPGRFREAVRNCLIIPQVKRSVELRADHVQLFFHTLLAGNGSVTMPKRKLEEQQVEIFEGEGVAGSLELVLAPGTASGYAGVRPSGRMWLARQQRRWRHEEELPAAQAGRL